MVVKTRGILMKGEMIRAYMAGLKTQTRRVRGLDEINKSPDDWEFLGFQLLDQGKKNEGVFAVFRRKDTFEGRTIRLPYGPDGPVGGTLWFRETYALICKDVDCGYCNFGLEGERGNPPDDILSYHDLEYRADSGNDYPGDWPAEDARGNPDAPKWQSSMFMKHIYSRFKDIPILNVRVERLKDITHDDALAEGFPTGLLVYESVLPVTWYYSLWDKLNGDKMPVDRNPWVWVYEFPKYAPSVPAGHLPQMEKHHLGESENEVKR